ncbi:hypothetical protein ES703_24971 [subsurface metagenome]
MESPNDFVEQTLAMYDRLLASIKEHAGGLTPEAQAKGALIREDLEQRLVDIEYFFLQLVVSHGLLLCESEPPGG